MSETTVAINGHIVPREGQHISVFDHGFLFGDSIYETMRTLRGHLLGYIPHMDRLDASAADIELELPVSRATMLKVIQESIARTPGDDHLVRLMITRGNGPLELAPQSAGPANWIVWVWPFRGHPASHYELGIRLVTAGSDPSLRGTFNPSCKSGNRLRNVLAAAIARREGANEAIMLSWEGHVTECTTSNIFIVRAGRIATPPLSSGLLAGITRSEVVGLMHSLELGFEEDTLVTDDLYTADEVFITSSTRGIMPVRSVDSVQYQAPGPITRQLMAAYHEHLESLVGHQDP